MASDPVSEARALATPPRLVRRLADEVERLRAQLTARETTDPDALPTGSIVLRDGVAWHRDATHWHLICGGHARWDRPFGSDPINVVYVPTEENPNA